MPLNYKTVQRIDKELVSFTCNKCKKEYEDMLEIQEMLYWKMTGGFGSVFGDGNTVELVLCQYCAEAVLDDYIENDNE